MSNPIRRVLALFAASLLLSAALSGSAHGAPVAQSDAASAAVDVMFLRPAGFVSLVFGTALFLAAAPIVLVTRPQEIGRPFQQLVVQPAKYVWVDPLGEH